MFNPIWLNTFVTVATSNSFTEAGRQLGLRQSSVSEHIRRLEESVGRRPFVCDTHSLALTADGEAMLVHARVILEAMAHAQSQFSSPRPRAAQFVRRSRARAAAERAGGLPRHASRRGTGNHHGMTGRLYQLIDAGELDLAVGSAVSVTRAARAFSAVAWNGLRRKGTVVDTSQPLPLILVAEPSVTRAVVLDALATLARAGKPSARAAARAASRRRAADWV